MCLTIITMCFVLGNALLILEVSLLKDNTELLIGAMVLEQILKNTASCFQAGRYIGVYLGNAYVMDNKDIPTECNKKRARLQCSLLAINWLVPLTLGVLLYISHTNEYRIVTCRTQFNYLMAFELINGFLQLTDAVILVVFICKTKKQLKKYGFNTKLHDASIFYQAIIALVLSSVELIGVAA